MQGAERVAVDGLAGLGLDGKERLVLLKNEIHFVAAAIPPEIEALAG